MHVNEVGYDPDLVSNVTPLETGDGRIHYFAHPKSPMIVGEPIELLVNYGSCYAEVRDRKGYGKSKLGGDEVESQRVKRNQAERVKIENQIYSQSLEEIYEMLINLQGTFESIIRDTDASVLKEVIPVSMKRKWKARFRLHWIETLLRKRCNDLRRMYKSRSNSEESLCVNTDKILDTMKFKPNCVSPCAMKHKVVFNTFAEEVLEENAFAVSRKKSIVQPLDPRIWCTLSRTLFYRVTEVSLQYRIGNCTIQDAVEEVYDMSKAAKEVIREACSNQNHDWKLGFLEILHLEDCRNMIGRVKDWHLKGIKNKDSAKRSNKQIPENDSDRNEKNKVQDDMQPILKFQNDKSALKSDPENYKHLKSASRQNCRVRHLQVISNERPRVVQSEVDEEWYFIWNIVRTIHIMMTTCLPAVNGGYSLLTFCEKLSIDIDMASESVNTQMDDPYGNDLYVPTHAGYDASMQKYSFKIKKRRAAAAGSKVKRIHRSVQYSLSDERQMANFLEGVHTNILRNRNSATFWCERQAGEKFPPGWIIHIHKRQAGKTGSGRHYDLYWFPPCGRKLRSMPEIKRYLKGTGEDEAIEKLC